LNLPGQQATASGNGVLLSAFAALWLSLISFKLYNLPERVRFAFLHPA
jgi:hypothetical protein